MFGEIEPSVAATATHRFRDILQIWILVPLVRSGKGEEASCRVVVQSIIDGMLANKCFISGQSVRMMSRRTYWLSFLIFIRRSTGIHGSFIIKLMRLLKQIVAGSFAFLNNLLFRLLHLLLLFRRGLECILLSWVR